MRYLFLVNTAAHAHTFKHAVRALEDRGHEVLILARDYGCTTDILDFENLSYEVYGYCDTTKFSLFTELPQHYYNLLPRARRYDPDVVFGIGSYAAHAGAVTGGTTVLVRDTEPAGMDAKMSLPFADAVITPYSFRDDLGSKQYRFGGFMESAYLHPDVFERRADVREKMGVGPDEDIIMLRFNAWGSQHDVGKSGFSRAQKEELLERLSEYGQVFVSDEKVGDSAENDAVAYDLHPGYMHDVLAEASLLVTDTQTMATEAGLLGTPVIRSNVFVGDDDMGNFVEMENQNLLENYREFDDVLERAVELAADPEAEERWAARREEYVGGLANLSDILVRTALAGGNPATVEGLRRHREPVQSMDSGSEPAGM